MKTKFTILILLVFMVVGCQTGPTRIGEGRDRNLEGAQLLQAIRITDSTIVIDARSPFDYSVAHIPRSIPLQWSDFTEQEATQRGRLLGDQFSIVRRLARLGIGPSSQVVVVGRGLEGKGEEGRVAWMLAYLGVTNVQFANLEAFNPRLTNAAETNFPLQVPAWKPEPIESLNVTREEIRFVLNHRGVDKPVRFEGRPPVLYKIIDVRPSKDYLGREGFGAKNSVPNMDAVNVPWQQFFSNDFRPRPEILQELMAVGISPEQRIIVLDDSGVSSAAVTMVLRALGYENAGNYSGGLVDLLTFYNKSN